MDFKSLNHVVAVADAGSFVRAAEQVALSQSAVSRSIQTIEEQLGVTLFDRTPAGVFLTPAGVTFVARARKILADTRALIESVVHHSPEIGGQVNFGAVPALAASCLGSLMAGCVTEQPALTLAVKVDTLPQMLGLLRDDKLDFVVAISDVITLSGEFDQQAVGYASGGGVFCRPGHPLQKLVAQTQTALDGERLCQYPLAVAGYDRNLDRLYHAIVGLEDSATLSLRLICDNLLILQQVVIRTDTLLITSQNAMQDLVDAGVFVELPVVRSATAVQPGEVVVLTRKGRSINPASDYLIAELRRLFSDMGAGTDKRYTDKRYTDQ